MIDFNIALQRQLIYSVLDEFTPSSALTELAGGPYGATPEAWSNAVVDFIVVTVRAGLVKPVKNSGYADLSETQLIKHLREGDPDRGLDVELFWNVIQFVGTKRLADLLTELGLASWESWRAGISMSLRDALLTMGVVRS